MDCRKVHEYIWGDVIKGLEYGLDEAPDAKRRAIYGLLYDGVITEEERAALHKSFNCVLCLLFRADNDSVDNESMDNAACLTCPLYKYAGHWCLHPCSPWQTVIDRERPLQERIDAAAVIRDIMRDETYTEGA